MSKTLLFQGDSITDCGRNRENFSDTGKGYVHLLASRLDLAYVENPMRIWNRGISGNRTKDLLARWQEDCLDLKPDILSIYIGVNNTWRRYDSDDPTPTKIFESELNDLLTRTFEQTDCTPAHSILIEPFLLDVPKGEKAHWMEDLGPKQAVIRKAATTFGTRFLPLQEIFNQVCHSAPPSTWVPDGVHPSRAGHQLIADAWMDEMKDIFKG